MLKGLFRRKLAPLIRPDLRGYVDTATKLELSGWALSTTREAHRPAIEVVQSGSVVLMAVPNTEDAAIRPVINLPPSSGPNRTRWKIMFPLSAGLVPDIPFEVRFQEGGSLLKRGQATIPLVDRMSEEARDDFDNGMLVSFHLAGEDEETLSLSAIVGDNGAGRPPPDLLVNGQPIGIAPQRIAAAPGKRLNRAGLRYAWRKAIRDLPGEYATTVGFSTPPELDARHAFHNELRTLQIPRSIRDQSLRAAPLPDSEGMRRVSGNIGVSQFLIAGLTTFMQIDGITGRYFGKRITEFPSVVDWGVGCARVMRHFFESAPRMGLPATDQTLRGFDIDSYNIDWCRAQMPVGEYGLLDRDGGLPLPEASVDLLYGISVMTHLSEYNQLKWLAEIRRVMRPGGCVILTTRAETVYYSTYGNMATFFVEAFGIADMTPDPTFGEEMSTYYRSTSNSRDYVRKVWGERFEIVDVVPAAMNFAQDYVVLRA